MIRFLSQFCVFLLAIAICTNNVSSQNREEVLYFGRVVNVTIVGPTDEPPIVEWKWTIRNFAQVYSSTFKVIRTYTIRRVFVKFERCRDLEIGCENFQTWNLTRFCAELMMKNQMWSSMVDSVTPKTFFQNCPRFNKGIYRMVNATLLNIGAIAKFYSEAPKYYWKISCMYYNAKNAIEYKTYVHLFFVKFTKRYRTTGLRRK